MALWNPPPPLSPGDPLGEGQEEEEALREPNNDAIGDSVFSKAWVLSLLVKAVSLVEVEEEEEEEEEGERRRKKNKDGTDTAKRQDSSDRRGAKKKAQDKLEKEEADLELDEEIENDLCQLWDASVNEVRLGVLCEWLATHTSECVSIDSRR